LDYASAKKHILERLWDELPANLFYHGVHHAIEVKEYAVKICKEEGVSPNDEILLKTAALFHDSGFITRYRDNETVGCTEAQNTLPKFNYTPAQIKKVCNMIKATKIPQSPKNHLEEILCDADLHYLGTGDFEEISDTLREELKTQGMAFSDQNWITYQLDFLGSHNFFTDKAVDELEPQKQRNIQFLKDELNKLKDQQK